MPAPRPPRTLVASVLFVDLVEFSRASDTEQIEVKRALTRILRQTLSSIPDDDYRLMDTGDGAALGFLADPEHALYFALAIDSACNGSHPSTGFGPGALRIGINLGPVKEVFDVNDHPSLIGDGMNTAQRIVGFADPGQITISRSFYELVSRLAPEYRNIFVHIGEYDDKHGREHDIYVLKPAKDILGKIQQRLQLTVAEATGVNVVFSQGADEIATTSSGTAQRAAAALEAREPAHPSVVWPAAATPLSADGSGSRRRRLLIGAAVVFGVVIASSLLLLRKQEHDGPATSAPVASDAGGTKSPTETPIAAPPRPASSPAAVPVDTTTKRPPADPLPGSVAQSPPSAAEPALTPAANSLSAAPAASSTAGKRPPRASGAPKSSAAGEVDATAPPPSAAIANPASRGSYSRCSSLMQKMTLGEALTPGERREIAEFCR
jgi:hypothetical protein